MKTGFIFILVLWLVCGASGAMAQSCLDYSLPTHFVNRLSVPAPGAGTMGTDLRAIDIAWPYAYAGGYPLQFNSPDFYVVDISDQANPEVVGSISDALTGIWDLEVHGDGVYAISGDLSIIDVSDPMTPVVDGEVPLPYWGSSLSVATGFDLAFVTCYDSGLVAVDISVPGAPAVISALTFGAIDSAKSVAVDYPYAYVALDAAVGFVIVDVSDPSNMQVVGSLPILARAVAVTGGFAYTAASDGLRVIDISNPLLPVVVGTAGGWDIDSVEVTGSIAYARSGIRPHLFDISDPENPVHKSQPNIHSANPAIRPIAVHDGYIYTAAGGQSNINGFGIEVGILGNDDGPFASHVGSLTDHLVYAMRFHGDLGYFVGDKIVGSDYQPTLSLYDIANPAFPSLLGTVGYSSARQSSAVDGNGTHAFVTGLYDLSAYDIAVPAAMTPISTLALDFTSRSLWLDGTHLYLTDGEWPDRGLRVYDVSDPGGMAEVGFVEIPADEDGINDVVIRGNYAYVTWGVQENYGTSGLDVVDISDPTLPVVVATVEIRAPARRIAIEGDHAWVSYGNGVGENALRLAAVDISNPLAPVKINDIGATYSTEDIGIVGEYLYLVTRFEGPAVINISDPLQAHGMGILDNDFSYGFRLAVGNGHVFATSWLGSGSVRIYAPQCSPISPVPDELPALAHLALEAHPNPFNPQVRLSFHLDEAQHVSLKIYDIAGREIASVLRGRMSAGPHRVQWKGRDDSGQAVASGVYFAKVVTAGGSDLVKLTLLK